LEHGLMADDSLVGNVVARYARALLDLAAEQGVLEAVEADLAALKAALKESADLRTLVASPRFDAEGKGKGLAAVAGRFGACETTSKFLGVLAANGRASLLPSVIDAFERLAAERKGLVAAKVTTAAPLTAAQAKSLSATLAATIGREPQIETVVDPAILGGIKVRVGSRLYDASLKTKLDSLKFALKRA
jgi:F-type H+-transporting ATPase subunit delta